MKHFKLILAVIIPLLIILLPKEIIPVENLTDVEHRLIAIFVFAALFWILEPIPIYATSVLIIVLELIFVSDKGLILSRNGNPEELGILLSYKEILETFASPIILLFLGGFFLAMAATKFSLDKTLARVLLLPFGTKPNFVMLGLMIITALFSMFMSNTATTAMMLAVLVPVLSAVPGNDKGKIGLTLAIPFAANIGGIGTPIGTPPNAIALQYLTGDNSIEFSKWMTFGVPYVIIMLFICWILLTRVFKSKTNSIEIDISQEFDKSPKAYIVYITFALTILLWLTDFVHGMNSYIVAMIPVAVFTTTGIINKEDLKRINWDVLWLVSGGIALGLGLEKSGLAQNLIDSISFSSFSPITILISCALLTVLMANFMSNTATANLLMPIFVALGHSISSLQGIGGVSSLIILCAITASMGMALPISTPPNALAHGMGFVSTKNMAKMGVTIGIIGTLLSFLTIYILNQVGFFG